MDRLDELGIEYLLGGSLASSIHGEPRSTRDADIVAELTREGCQALAERLETEFYLSLPAMHEAVRRGSSFNAVHLQTGFKIDVFVSKLRPFDRSRVSRRIEVQLAGRRFRLPTAEDTPAPRGLRTATAQGYISRAGRSSPLPR
ncbi:MAG: hypothetical protein HY319_00655 [Armatimonadetes bacterium]|nr:hypothetical protein [Armatimonadota bacterium]